ESDNITDIGLQHTFLSLKTHHTSLVPPLTHTDQDFHLPPPSLKLTPTLHKLISLNLSNSPAAITDTLLTILAWSTPNLHDIVLRNSAHITDMGVSRLAEGCTLLEHVDVGGCARVGLASFEALGLCCGRTIRVLRAPFCPRVTDECLRALLSLCTHLRVLSVDDCPRVSDAFLEALAADPVPSLEVVEVRDCARVTMRAVRDALARVNRPEREDGTGMASRILRRRGSVDSEMTVCEMNDRMAEMRASNRRRMDLVIKSNATSTALEQVFGTSAGRRGSASGLMDLIFGAF
ncbi:hypothetical protein BC830DRAFT_104902, partial [Chytriomyces sp. MP71]